MAINLQKGQSVDMSFNKINIGLSIGMPCNIDFDAMSFMVDSNRQIPDSSFFIFYNNTQSPDTALYLIEDDPRGNCVYGDDQTIVIDLNKVESRIQEILFIVTIHDAERLKQNFGKVGNIYIRIVENVTQKEIFKYELCDFAEEIIIEFGRFFRKDDKWMFEASGIGFKQNLSLLIKKYYKSKIDTVVKQVKDNDTSCKKINKVEVLNNNFKNDNKFNFKNNLLRLAKLLSILIRKKY